MAPRSISLSYQEWVLICEEWSDAKWHSFQLSKKEIKHWEDLRKEYGEYADEKCFKRVNVYPYLDNTQNPIVFNALCRENYRGQDMSDIMNDVVSFVGLVINYDDKNCHDKVTLNEWEDRMNKIKEYMDKSGKSVWFARDIMKVFYQECMPQVLVAQ